MELNGYLAVLFYLSSLQMISGQSRGISYKGYATTAKGSDRIEKIKGASMIRGMVGEKNRILQKDPKIKPNKDSSEKKNKNNEKKNEDSNRKENEINPSSDDNPILTEIYPCIPFEDPDIQAMSKKKECMTNSCNRGCCRIKDDELRCDDENGMPFHGCVCNGNTKVWEDSTFTWPPSFQDIDPPENVDDTTTISPGPSRAPTKLPTNAFTPAPTTPLTSFPTPPPSSPPTLPPTSSPSATITNPPTSVQSLSAGISGNANAPPSPPLTMKPTQSPPLTMKPTQKPTVATPGNGASTNVLPDHCKEGSMFHKFAQDNKCFEHKDCKLPNHCCLKNFCLCGSPTGIANSCVPPYPDE